MTKLTFGTVENICKKANISDVMSTETMIVKAKKSEHTLLSLE